ncbi:hypothetical protein VZT92_010421 [Zoarces viviparus]
MKESHIANGLRSGSALEVSYALEQIRKRGPDRSSLYSGTDLEWIRIKDPARIRNGYASKIQTRSGL